MVCYFKCDHKWNEVEPGFETVTVKLCPFMCSQTKMEGGQSGTYLRQTRASSGPRVSITKTYRDETKINISARSQWPSSPVEYRRRLSLLYSTAEEGHCDLAKIFIFFSFRFISICLSNTHPQAGRCSRLSYVSAALSPFHFCLFPASPGFPYYITTFMWSEREQWVSTM